MVSRRPEYNRILPQSEAIFQHAGHVVTWRKFIGTGAGTPVAGLGGEAQYNEHKITALIGRGGNPRFLARQLPVGSLVAGQSVCLTHEKLSSEDEIIWNDDTYRVDSESTPSKFGNNWFTVLRRGET